MPEVASLAYNLGVNERSKRLGFLLLFLAVSICPSSWSVLDTENHVDSRQTVLDF